MQQNWLISMGIYKGNTQDYRLDVIVKLLLLYFFLGGGVQIKNNNLSM